MIRPEIRRLLRDWAEPLAAILAGVASLWLTRLGGWFFGALGLGGGVVALIWLIGALRRARFRREIAAPGLVEIDEGAVRYYGARMLGGQVALRDLAEVRLLRLDGHPHWRLKTVDGQALLVPLEAAGAEALADGFAALPGIDMGAVAAALKRSTLPDGPAFATVWTRPGRGAPDSAQRRLPG